MHHIMESQSASSHLLTACAVNIRQPRMNERGCATPHSIEQGLSDASCTVRAPVIGVKLRRKMVRESLARCGLMLVMAVWASKKVPPGGTALTTRYTAPLCSRSAIKTCGTEMTASLTPMKHTSGIPGCQAARHMCHKTALQVVALRLRRRLGAHQIRRFAALLSTSLDGTNLLWRP